MLLGLVQPFLRAAVSLELAEISIPRGFLLHYTLHDLIFHRSVSIVPSLHRQKLCIFTLFTPLALFSYATWSSTIFLASWRFGLPLNFFIFTDLVSITSIHACMIRIFHTSVYRLFLHCTDVLLVFLNSLHLYLHSHIATWSSAIFLASWSEPRICWNFYTPMVSITLQPVGLGLFTASSPIVPLWHRLKPSIFKLFKPLASFSYAIWSSAPFLWSCS